MSTETAKVEVSKGLSIRRFKGEIDKTPDIKDKDKKTILSYLYDRILLPWNRFGKDHEEKEVTGSVPSLSEVMGLLAKEGFSTEFKLDKEGNPESPNTVVGFLIDGYNRYLSALARTKAENTPESAKEKAIQMVMAKTGLDRTATIALLKGM